MPWQLTFYSILGGVSAGISALIALQAWYHRDQRGVRTFSWLMVALSGWALASGIQLGFTSRASQLLWLKIALGIGGTVPPLWFLFTVKYSGREKWLSRRLIGILALEPLIFLSFLLTNTTHGFILESATLTTAPTALELGLEAGYYLHIAWAYLLVSTGLVLLILLLFETSSLYHKQTSLLMLGALPPFIANIAYTLQLSWGPLPAIDLTPFAFSVTGILFGLALFQFDLLQRTPIARERALEEMGDGLIALDTEGQIVDINMVAKRAFDPDLNLGDSVTALVEKGQTTEEALSSLDGRTISATVNGRERAYDVDWTELTGPHGELVGHVLGVRDVTERNEYEQRLEVTQRILRHNLRNDMNVIQGWADHLAREAPTDEANVANRIAETADDLIQLSEKTRTMTRLGQTSSEDVTVDVRSRTESLVETFQHDNPGVAIERDLPEMGEVTIQVPNQDLFEIPVRNLIENAIQHNDDQNPWVRVRVSQDVNAVRIHVEDDGPEIPDMEREVLQAGSEEPLQHGSGVGLWLTYWGVRTIGGDISFATRDPRGNVVTLEFPKNARRSSYLLAGLLVDPRIGPTRSGA